MGKLRCGFVTLGMLVLGASIGCAEGSKTEATSAGGAGGTGGSAVGGSAAGGTGGDTATSSTGTGGTGAGGGQGGSGGTGTGGGGAAPACGDGVVGAGEECDGATGKSCADLGFSGEGVGCTAACTFDLSKCSGCGDGAIQQQLGEECDFDAQGDPLVAATCQSLGYPLSGANPGCRPNCKFDIRVCQCGNGELDDREICDGALLAGHSCVGEGFAGGMLGCTPDCTLDTSGCTLCQDGTIDPGEACDGANLGTHTCKTEGFGSGMLGCTPGCALDTSGCSLCQNGAIDPGEGCDGANLGAHTCKTEGFGSGTLSCTAQCGLDTSGCSLCGNGVVNPGSESCDDGNTVAGDGCDASCQVEVTTCDPDGVYAIVGNPISYSCCFGLVSVNVSSFLFSANGASIGSSPSNPVAMAGQATTCPVGAFDNSGTIPGGCAETYHLTGSYNGPDSWSGTYEVKFTGPDCSCFGGAGVPCVNQLFNVNAQR